MEYGPLSQHPGDMGSDEDVEVDPCIFHGSAAILVPGKHGREAM